MSRRVAWLLVAAGILVVGVAVFMTVIIEWPMFHPDLVQRRAVLDQQAHDGKIDVDEERRLAEVYWRRYLDVAGNPYFGRDGILGVFGAREHYERFGRAEGRIWGTGPRPGEGGAGQ